MANRMAAVCPASRKKAPTCKLQVGAEGSGAHRAALKRHPCPMACSGGRRLRLLKRQGHVAQVALRCHWQHWACGGCWCHRSRGRSGSRHGCRRCSHGRGHCRRGTVCCGCCCHWLGMLHRRGCRRLVRSRRKVAPPRRFLRFWRWLRCVCVEVDQHRRLLGLRVLAWLAAFAVLTTAAAITTVAVASIAVTRAASAPLFGIGGRAAGPGGIAT